MAINAMGEVEREGKEVLTGSADLAADGTLAVSTPFARIDSVSAIVVGSSAPTTVAFSYAFSGGTVTIHGWKATASGDTTQIASDAEETIAYTIIGRRWRG